MKVMKYYNNNKSDFWESDVFVEKELSRIWKLYHSDEECRERERDPKQ